MLHISFVLYPSERIKPIGRSTVAKLTVFYAKEYLGRAPYIHTNTHIYITYQLNYVFVNIALDGSFAKGRDFELSFYNRESIIDARVRVRSNVVLGVETRFSIIREKMRSRIVHAHVHATII